MTSPGERQLRQQIERHLGKSRATEWTIGVTYEPEKEREKLTADGEGTRRWRHWRAPSAVDAYKTRNHFKKMKMKATRGISGEFVYVY